MRNTQSVDNVISDNANDLKKKYFVIPYISKVSYSVTAFFNKSIFTIGYRILNTFLFHQSTQKQINKFHYKQLNKFQNQNVVYQINCQDEASYVGQTKT